MPLLMALARRGRGDRRRRRASGKWVQHTQLNLMAGFSNSSACLATFGKDYRMRGQRMVNARLFSWCLGRTRSRKDATCISRDENPKNQTNNSNSSRPFNYVT